MKITSISAILLSLSFRVLVFSFPLISASSISSQYDSFLQCLSTNIHSSDPPIPIYLPNTSFYSRIWESRIGNLRFLLNSTTPKPNLIVKPLTELQVQRIVICGRKYNLQIRTRSGGHDYEGLSYSTYSDTIPFVMLDLQNFRSADIELEAETAWIQSGLTLIEFYQKIAEKTSSYGFPAGVCIAVGVGGYFSGGGYGYLLRKYGFAADNIIDAVLVNANGEILNRASMGEDLFWAIRGGGGGSFGIVLSWRIQLLPVPPAVTIFNVYKTLEQGAIPLIYKWQHVAPNVTEDLVIPIYINKVNASRAQQLVAQKSSAPVVVASFLGMYLGGTKELLDIMNQTFPELGVTPEHCTEMSWAESIIYIPNILSDFGVSTVNPTGFKSKVDYAQEVISETALQGMWNKIVEADSLGLFFFPLGGKNSEIEEDAIPFPHRAGNLYEIAYGASWNEPGEEAANEGKASVNGLYEYMTPYVSKSPRGAYVNYRDLDLGHNNFENSSATYEEAKVWGIKYFGNNFDRLVRVKSAVDPDNFFRNEQSIPPVASLAAISS